VAVAKTPIAAGESVLIGGQSVVFTRVVPTGHKVAILAIVAGQQVIKYGAPIGSATRDIGPRPIRSYREPQERLPPDLHVRQPCAGLSVSSPLPQERERGRR